MKIVVTAAICCSAFVLASEEKYTTKFDNVDFEEIIHSERLLKNYVNCLLDRGNCSPDGRELKRILPDALETDCRKCSDAQKEGIAKVVKHLLKNNRDWWNELEQKYDSHRLYIQKYREKWQNEGFTFDE